MQRMKITTRMQLVLLCGALLMTMPVAAGTTELHIMKYTSDGTTIINETSVSFQWMMANLPVYGDAITHYYHQGPVFNASITDKWNPEESDPAILTKDYGAVKGTNVKDLCDLVGGMAPDDLNMTLRASDGFTKRFVYSSIYAPPSRAGPIVITWYRADEGYVNGSYASGMRNVMFADTSTNTWGKHVFGLWDMHESYPEEFWYYYQPGQPSTTGLSVQNISEVRIYSHFPIAMEGQGNAPTDPDGDHIYEDLNGNGELDFNDVVVYFKKMEWLYANEPVSLFDLNGNNDIDFNDVVRLFKEV